MMVVSVRRLLCCCTALASVASGSSPAAAAAAAAASGGWTPPRPTPRQLDLMGMEFAQFMHFGINTFWNASDTYLHGDNPTFHNCYWVRKTPLFAPFIYKNEHFTKTGSGQT
jgi:hypothetical protein